ncbi:MAG: DoxX family protein, partial [Rhizobiaceae bacterium]
MVVLEIRTICSLTYIFFHKLEHVNMKQANLHGANLVKPLKKYGLLVVKTLLTLAFLAAGLAKLAGAEMMVQTFEAVGIGQWFRYVTGLIEVGSAILLWIPGRQFVGSVLLVCTMIGAVLAHLLI